MAQITYADKTTMNSNSSIPAINKCQASDMNEIKSVVNNNYNEVGDITTLTTTDKSSIVNAINEVNTKDIITVYVTSTYTASSAADYIPNSLTINSQLGNKLSVSGGNVVIGSGVSKILVSGTAVLSLSGSGSKIRNFSIRKNDTNQKTASENFSHTGWAKISITSALIDVEEGDTIKIQSYLQSGDKLNGGYAYTYITLEVVEYS
ncbi:MAG: hypothetical protein VZQ62_00935 [Methanosphaera sp.]|nr:hypothetical protein [Methanosphaera sp.]